MQTNSKKLLLEWEDNVIQSLVEGFRQLFESSSQVLLEFADAAENNRVQRLFFDAQREFYLKEETIIGEFEHSLRDNLLAFAGGPKHDPRLGADTLSLVEVEDYERSLALETIAKRTVERQRDALHALAQRLSALLGGRPLPVDDVPANPLQIIRLFDPVSRKLDVEKEVRLVFYTLFDRYVMSRLGDLYDDFNRRLVDIGILPNIRYDFERQPPGTSAGGESAADNTEESMGGAAAAPAAGAGAYAGGVGAAPGGGPSAGGGFADSNVDGAKPQRLRPSTPTSTETLAAISSLLMAKRRQQREAEPPLRTSVPIEPTAASVGDAIADDRVLQEAPNPIPMPSTQAGQKIVSVDAELLVKVKNALQRQRRIIKSLVGRDKLERHEEDVIDIVGMLFEAMLNEKLLPNTVKTLLSHLHTRYLKIAVQSDDFLDNTRHPARLLFERMLDAGIRWVREDNLRAGIYPQLQQLVTDILRHDTLDNQFFVDKIAELDKAEQRLEQQSTAAEERTLEAERGRARLDQAKAIVRQTIDDIGGNVEIAAGVVNFLTTTYADYLTLLLLRSDLDTESQPWSNAYSVGEALIAAAVHAASGQPLSEDVRADLTKRLQETVGSLIPHHEQNVRRVITALGSAPDSMKPAASAAEQTPAAGKDSQAKAASGTGGKQDAGAEITQADQQLADKLMREAGNWFVMQTKDREEQAVKLLWVNPHTRNMLLVDQHGTKVALIPATTMARQIREQTLRPMEQETSSFVARSLRRIRRALEDSVTG